MSTLQKLSTQMAAISRLGTAGYDYSLVAISQSGMTETEIKGFDHRDLREQALKLAHGKFADCAEFYVLRGGYQVIYRFRT